MRAGFIAECPSSTLARLDASRRRLEAAIDGLSEYDRLRRLVPDEWSVVETVEHLVLVEAPLERFLSRHLPAEFLRTTRSADQSSGVKIRLSARSRIPNEPDAALYAPLGQVSWLWVWKEATAVRTRLRATLGSIGASAEHAIITRPGFAGVRANLNEWVVWLADHEERHAARVHDLHTDLKRRACDGGSIDQRGG